MKILENLKSIARIRSGKDQQRGFTLIELVVVIAILGVLIAVAVPQFANFQDEAELNAVASTLSSSASTAFATDLLNNDDVEGDWRTSVCEDLIDSGLIEDADDNFSDYVIGDADGDGDGVDGPVATFSAPAFDADGNNVVTDECEVGFDTSQ